MKNSMWGGRFTEAPDAVMEEIPKVRREMGYIPLVTPTSQIVGTQAAFNVIVALAPFARLPRLHVTVDVPYGASALQVEISVPPRLQEANGRHLPSR